MKPSIPSYLLSFLFLLFSLSNFAFNKADSLLTVAKDETRNTKDRLNAYSDLVYHFESSDPKKSIEIGKEGLLLPRIDSLKNELAFLYVNIAFVYNTSQDYNKAILDFQIAADIYMEAGNIKSAALQIKNIGVCHRKLGNYTESIKFQLNCLEKYESIGDIKGQTAALMNIGNIYIFQKQAQLALPYYKKAYDMAMNQEDKLLKADANNSYALGFDNSSKKDSALFYYLIAAEYYGELKKWVKKAKIEHNIALIYLNRDEYDKAEQMLQSSYAIFKQAPSSMDIEKATIQLNLARVYSKNKDFQKAISFFNSSLSIFQEKGAKTEMKSCYNYLANTYSEMGDYENAYSNYKNYLILKDSIQNVEITTQIAELNEKYESEKKEKEILSLQNEKEKEASLKWMILNFAGGIIAIIIILFLVYRQKKIKQEEQNKARFEQTARELDILREKIANETFQFNVKNEFTLSKKEVNESLKEELSERELDVFMLLFEGLTNKEMGEKLFVSVNTIKYHLQNIYVKLDVDNRSDAVKSLSNTRYA